MSNVVEDFEIEIDDLSESLSRISLSDSEIPIGKQLSRTPISYTIQPSELDDNLLKLTEQLNLLATDKQLELVKKGVEEETLSEYTPKAKKSFKELSQNFFGKTRSNPLYVTVDGLE